MDDTLLAVIVAVVAFEEFAFCEPLPAHGLELPMVVEHLKEQLVVLIIQLPQVVVIPNLPIVEMVVVEVVAPKRNLNKRRLVEVL